MERENFDAEQLDEFELTSWGMMDDELRAAWLTAFILGRDYQKAGTGVTFNGYQPELDANLIAECENSLDDDQTAQYLTNCLSEASVIAYEGMSDNEVNHPSTALKFYKTLMMLPLESRARSMYWAYRGEGV